jgi:surfactin synthase thioesterase subunit
MKAEKPFRGWLRRPRPASPLQRLRLFCLPHAGGTPGLFRRLLPLLPDWIEPVLVCPPGREDRLNDPFHADLASMADDLADAAAPLLAQPWALFGHSMGAALGFELALRSPRPAQHLFLSAREAPQHHRGGGVHRLDDAALGRELLRLGGTAPDILAIPELLALVLPAVRADYRLIETWEARPAGRVACPISIFRGLDDPDLTEVEALGWREWTSGPFHIQPFAGGHFYLLDDPAPVAAALVTALS